MEPTVEELFDGLYEDDDELMHYGRKGMRWYQHIFGKEPTSSGQRRSSSGGKPAPSTRTQSGERQDYRNKTTTIKTYKSKSSAASNVKKLSDRDLEQIIRRIEQENKYVSLTYNPSIGKRLGSWVLQNGRKTIVNASTKAAENAFANAITKYLNKKYPSTTKVK